MKDNYFKIFIFPTPLSSKKISWLANSSLPKQKTNSIFILLVAEFWYSIVLVYHELSTASSGPTLNRMLHKQKERTYSSSNGKKELQACEYATHPLLDQTDVHLCQSKYWWILIQYFSYYSQNGWKVENHFIFILAFDHRWLMNKLSS